MLVFSTTSTKPLYRLVCLNGQKIYGFKHRKLDESFFIVFGGKQFTVVLGPNRSEAQDGLIVFTRLFEPVVSDDWLHAVAWGPGDMGAIIVLTAHNIVQVNMYNYIPMKESATISTCVPHITYTIYKYIGDLSPQPLDLNTQPTQLLYLYIYISEIQPQHTSFTIPALQ